MFSWEIKRRAKISTTLASLLIPHDFFIRPVRDVRGAKDGGEVVFAVGHERNIAHDHHVVISIDIFKRGGQFGGGVHRVSGEKFVIGTNKTGRGVDQAGAGGVFADIAQNGFHGGPAPVRGRGLNPGVSTA
jgi:hypothetical protein